MIFFLRQKKRKGSSIVEGAIATLLFLTLSLSAVDMGLAYWIDISLDNAAFIGSQNLMASGTIANSEAMSIAALPNFAKDCVQFDVIGWNSVSGTDFVDGGVELSPDTLLTPGMAVSYTARCHWSWLTPLNSMFASQGINLAKTLSVGIR